MQIWTNAARAIRLTFGFLQIGAGLAVAAPASEENAATDAFASGIVFDDRNRNRVRDAGEPGLAHIRVSNQREIVLTDSDGRWRLPALDDCVFFVVKPRGWMTPVNAVQLPQFYYVHKPHGSPNLFFRGVPPTGQLPESIDFPLHRQEEPDRFQAVFFGDTQPRDLREVEYIAHDVVEELVGTQARFGVTLGDIVFDNLDVFDPLNATVALIGIPWYNVIGNHDINYDTPDDRLSDETFERVYGPNFYSFDYGPVHFIVLDDVLWEGQEPEGSGRYHGEFGAAQLEFVKRDLEFVPPEQLVVLMMHIPLFDVVDREQLYRLIEDRPYTLSISGHTHWQAHRFITREDGWRGPEPHHHLVNVTVCGSWWSGAPDEYGIPHTMMADGAPNGYSIITFDGHRATVDFKAARRPADFQMTISAPEAFTVSDLPNHPIYVNVFAGSPRSIVEMRIGRTSAWLPLNQVKEFDPNFLRLKSLETPDPQPPFRNLPKPKLSEHLWKGTLPEGVAPGIHFITVRTRDQYERIFEAQRVITVLPDPPPEVAVEP